MPFSPRVFQTGMMPPWHIERHIHDIEDVLSDQTISSDDPRWKAMIRTARNLSKITNCTDLTKRGNRYRVLDRRDLELLIEAARESIRSREERHPPDDDVDYKVNEKLLELREYALIVSRANSVKVKLDEFEMILARRAKHVELADEEETDLPQWVPLVTLTKMLAQAIHADNGAWDECVYTFDRAVIRRILKEAAHKLEEIEHRVILHQSRIGSFKRTKRPKPGPSLFDGMTPRNVAF